LKSKIIDSIIVFALSYGVLYFFLGDQLIHPDQYVYAFGGDAAFLYYNTIFHTWYGDGWLLSNMNYPVHESILMTDAQATISMLLNKLNGVPFVREHIVGIIHSFHYLCIVLASLFSYGTLKKLGVNSWMAILFGILIVFLSPQLLRLRAGHIGLAYPLVFTAIIYALVSYKVRAHWKYGLLIFAVLLFFGINNIYLLILGSGLASLFIVVDYLWKLLKRNSKTDHSALSLLPFAIVPVIIVFALIKMTAPEMDRIDIQWGYFANRIKLKGLIYPYTSLIGTWMGKPKGNIEAVTNIGIVNAIVLIGGIISLVVPKWRRRIPTYFKGQSVLKSLLWAAIIMLIYGMGSLKFLAELFPAATMFKASGRFAWPFYYVISLISITALYKLCNSLALSQRKNIGIGIVVLAAIIWTAEDYNYLKNHVKFKLYGNHYHHDKLMDIKEGLIADGIETKHYQGIYSLPVMVGWNDKFHTKAPWSTEYNSTRISMATGLPLINGMLSRIGVSRANQLVQMASHPLIEKEVLASLDDRPILIVLGKKHKLEEGEQYLISQSQLVQDNKGYSLYKLIPSDLNRSLNLPCKDNKLSFFRKGFDDNLTTDSFFGKGSWVINEEEKIFDSASSFLTDSLYELSIYVKTDNHKYGMPWIRLKQFADDKLMKEEVYDIAASKDIDHMWRRAGMQFSKEKGSNRLEVHFFNINQSFIIDELQIRSVQDTVCIRIPEEPNRKLYNNYRVVD